MDKEMPVLPGGWVAMREENLRKLEWKAERDFLTGLYSRGGFEGAVAKRLELGGSYLFILVDLDDFKQINDRFGHLAGDKVIKRVAEALHDAFGDELVGRVGGDEFAALVALPPQREAVAVRMAAFAEAVAKNAPPERDVCVTVSAGAAHFPDDARDYTALFGAADRALYAVKSAGKKNFSYYTAP